MLELEVGACIILRLQIPLLRSSIFLSVFHSHLRVLISLEQGDILSLCVEQHL